MTVSPTATCVLASGLSRFIAHVCRIFKCGRAHAGHLPASLATCSPATGSGLSRCRRQVCFLFKCGCAHI